MKRITISTTVEVEIEIDETSSIVKEYESEQELIDDLVSYHFKILPVIGNGVEIINMDVIEYSKI